MPIDDALPALLGLVVAVMEAMTILIIGLINLFAILIELIVGIFVSGFKVRRIEQRKSVQEAKSSIISIVIILLVAVGSVGWFAIAPRVLNEEVSFVTTEGKGISYLGVTIHSKSGDESERTDRDGVILIPRLGTQAITVKDPRYVEKTWDKSEFESRLRVERSAMGSGLDAVKDGFLKWRSRDREPSEESQD